jgi:hypothetical protein
MSINIFGFKTIIVNDTQVTSDNYIDIFIFILFDETFPSEKVLH